MPHLVAWLATEVDPDQKINGKQTNKQKNQ